MYTISNLELQMSHIGFPKNNVHAHSRHHALLFSPLLSAGNQAKQRLVPSLTDLCQVVNSSSDGRQSC